MSKDPTSAENDRLVYFGRTQLGALGFDAAFAKKVQRVIDEGLDATSVKVMQHGGTLVKDEPRPDHDARHKFAELSTKILDWLPSKIEHEVHGEVGITILGLDASKAFGGGEGQRG